LEVIRVKGNHGPRQAGPRSPGAAGRAAGRGSALPSGLRAVAALELLAAPAPARVVAAEVLLAVARHALLGHHRAAAGIERPRGHAAAVAGHQPGRAAAGRRDRLRARERLVLVGEAIAGLRGLRLLERLGVLDLDLRVEECLDDLSADLEVQLLEHPVAL